MTPVQSIVTFNRVTTYLPVGFLVFVFFGGRGVPLSVNGINKQENSLAKKKSIRVCEIYFL